MFLLKDIVKIILENFDQQIKIHVKPKIIEWLSQKAGYLKRCFLTILDILI